MRTAFLKMGLRREGEGREDTAGQHPASHTRPPLPSPLLPSPRSPENGQRGKVRRIRMSLSFSGRLKGQEGEPWATSCWPGFELYQGRDSTYLFSRSYKNIPHHHPRHLCITVFPSVTKPRSPSPFTSHALFSGGQVSSHSTCLPRRGICGQRSSQ